MAELKTKPTSSSVQAFLNQIADENKRADAFTILKLMQEATGAEPRMWGTSIVGFGERKYKYANGREGDWFIVGFAPRKQDLTLYLSYAVLGDRARLERLGKFKTGKACLYIKRLTDVDLKVLKQLIRQAISAKRPKEQTSHE